MSVPFAGEEVRPLSDVASGAEGFMRAAAHRAGPTILMDGDERVAVVLPDALYRQLSEAAARLDLVEALDSGEAAAAAGQTMPQAEVVAWVRTWKTPRR